MTEVVSTPTEAKGEKRRSECGTLPDVRAVLQYHISALVQHSAREWSGLMTGWHWADHWGGNREWVA